MSDGAPFGPSDGSPREDSLSARPSGDGQAPVRRAWGHSQNDMPKDKDSPSAAEGRETTPEAQAWWRALVRPIFLAMHDRGIGELRIKRIGTKVIFELTPEDPPRAANASNQTPPPRA